jgi:hypothetical protein
MIVYDNISGTVSQTGTMSSVMVRLGAYFLTPFHFSDAQRAFDGRFRAVMADQARGVWSTR